MGCNLRPRCVLSTLSRREPATGVVNFSAEMQQSLANLARKLYLIKETLSTDRCAKKWFGLPKKDMYRWTEQKLKILERLKGH